MIECFLGYVASCVSELLTRKKVNCGGRLRAGGKNMNIASMVGFSFSNYQ